MSEQQLQIINSNNKNIIVDAGSGSGKTRVLTERVKKILESGVDPLSVVVITFTNMAADELKLRLSNVLGIDKCFVGTIHSYANSLLKKTGFEFDIFSEYYQTQFMMQLIPKYARYCTMDDYNAFVRYDRLVAAGRMSEHDISKKFYDKKVYNEIQILLGNDKIPHYEYPETVKSICKANNIITFDELIKLTTEYFKAAKTELNYLFVDELQDIGYLEYNFLMRLNSKNNFFIGDDYQSIYGFKGGDVGIFLSLMKNPDWTPYYLSENYRTAKSILLYANNIVSKSKDIIKKDVVCMNKNIGKLEFLTKSMLESFLGKLMSNEDWFILTRNNKEMVQVDTILKKSNIDHYCFKQSNISHKKLKEIMSKPCIKVMTIHAAKGLECENVALYGKLPVKGTGSSEELKVYYVGLTRAKNRCVVFI